MPRERAQQAMPQAASKPPTAPALTTTAATPSVARTSGRDVGPPCAHRTFVLACSPPKTRLSARAWIHDTSGRHI